MVKKKTTPEDYTHKKDIRSEEGTGAHGLHDTKHTRSGHVFSLDDTSGKESITIQHRTGSAIQFRPDGGVQYTTHNGKYEVVFGEDRITISGAQDITVKGDASLRVYGDYNLTCHKNFNLAVMGDLNITAKNKNQLIRGNKDTIAQNETKKLSGSSSGTYLGGYARSASEGVSVISRTNKAYFGAGDGVSIEKAGEMEDGDVTIRNKKGNTVQHNDDGKHAVNVEKDGKKVYMVADSGKWSVKADDETNIKTQKSLKVETTQNFGVDAKQGVEVKAGQNMKMEADGQAGFKGSTTHVGGMDGTTHIVGTTTHVEGSGTLNLNVGGGLGLPQLSFNFGELMEQIPMPDMGGGGALTTEAEAEADSWTSRLA